MSPTTIFTSDTPWSQLLHSGPWWRGCTRGGGDGVGPGEGYTGTPPGPSQGPIISHILSLRPYPRPNEGNSQVIDEVSEIRVQN